MYKKNKKYICFYLTVVLILALSVSSFFYTNGTEHNTYVYNEFSDFASNSQADCSYVAIKSNEDKVAGNNFYTEPNDSISDEFAVNTHFDISTNQNVEPSSTETSFVSEEYTKNEHSYSHKIYNISNHDSDVFFTTEPQTTAYSQTINSNDATTAYSENMYHEALFDLLFLSPNEGMLIYSDTVNIYQFTLDSKQMFKYSFRHDKLNSLGGWKIDLYAEYYINGDNNETAYRLINSLNTKTGETVHNSPELGLAPGNYRLIVSAGNIFSSEPYKLLVSLSDNVNFETECNDNIYRYNEIYSGVAIKGSASALADKNDEDWFMLRVYEPSFINLSFSHPEIKDKLGICWQVFLLREDGSELISVNSSFSQVEFNSGNIGLTPGNYYIAVKNRVYTDITYTLLVERTVDTFYENEKNDISECANEILLNSYIIGNSSPSISNVDRDYFKFNVTDKGIAKIEFAHAPIGEEDDKIGWHIKLYNSNHRLIYFTSSTWTDDVIASSDIGLDKGIYYISVDNEGTYYSNENYTLSVFFTENNSWETEINNTVDTADVMEKNKEIFGILSNCGTEFDFDYYTFTIEDTSDISLVFSHEIINNDNKIFEFNLYNSEMKPVSCFVNENEIFTVPIYSKIEKTEALFKTLTPGKYYLRIAPGSHYDEIPYSLIYNTTER